MTHHLEHDNQVTFFQIMEFVEHEAAGVTFAVPNGARLRSVQHARRVHDEGMRSGVPDIICAAPYRGKAGLAIEMKVGKNKPTPNQVMWHTRLRHFGWQVSVCYSAMSAFMVWADYVNMHVQERERVMRNFFPEAYMESQS